jgi:peptidoglycan-associated lipoprotein
MYRPVSRSTIMLAAAGTILAACHHQPPAVAPATPVASTTSTETSQDDSMARERAARDAAARAAAAAADSTRRAADAARAAEADARTQLLAPVHFDFDQAEIRAEDQANLGRKAAIIVANPALRIHIDGNTDERGSDEYNLALGMRRAGAVREYLANHGVDASRVTIASNGEERRVCQGHDESCWSQNRRDEFSIAAGGGRIVAVR